MCAGALEHRSAEACVGACIKVDLAVEPGNDSVLITADGKAALHRMSFRVHTEGFASAELDFDRTLELHGSQRGDVLCSHIFFAAEAAADQLVFNHDSLRSVFPAEHMQNFVSGVKGALVS